MQTELGKYAKGEKNYYNCIFRNPTRSAKLKITLRVVLDRAVRKKESRAHASRAQTVYITRPRVTSYPCNLLSFLFWHQTKASRR